MCTSAEGVTLERGQLQTDHVRGRVDRVEEGEGGGGRDRGRRTLRILIT